MIMKNLFNYLSFRASEARARYGISLILIAILVGISSCDNDDDNDCQGVDCLPPITQTGAGTFGCLVNGEPFVDNSGDFNCFYQLVDGEYFFNISPSFLDDNILELDLGSNNVNLSTNSQFALSDYSDGVGAAIFFIAIGNRNIETSTTNPGICNIEFFDLQNNIISGVFEFTILDASTGITYEVTEGRFDAIFTQ